MMPSMDGFEVCRIIKADPTMRGIPVILVTALGQLQDKVTGLDSGADDFINKPYEEGELQARVRSALRMKSLYDQLQNLLLMRDHLVRMIMHDMGNMVTIIDSALSMSQRSEPEMFDSSPYLRDAYEANQSLSDLINDALDVSSMETHGLRINREETDLAALSRSILDLFRATASISSVALELTVEQGLDTIANVDPALLRRVIANMISNAIKHAPEESTVRVQLSRDTKPNVLQISVHDQGPGISVQDQNLIFDKYRTVQLFTQRQQRPGRGLGLTFSKMAVEAHNGTITVDSEPGQGATFTVKLPHARSDNHSTPHET
jgi:signal transduction histidine kinase